MKTLDKDALYQPSSVVFYYNDRANLDKNRDLYASRDKKVEQIAPEVTLIGKNQGLHTLNPNFPCSYVTFVLYI